MRQINQHGWVRGHLQYTQAFLYEPDFVPRHYHAETAGGLFQMSVKYCRLISNVVSPPFAFISS